MTKYTYEYGSQLRKYFYAFLDFKASTMHDVFSYAFLFKQIDEFLVNRDYEKSYIDREIYIEWKETQMANVSSATASCRHSMMRTFLIFTTKMGNECYIPPAQRQLGKTYVPHISHIPSWVPFSMPSMDFV